MKKRTLPHGGPEVSRSGLGTSTWARPESEDASTAQDGDLRRTSPAPVAEWVDPAQLMADPYPSYERLRAEAPVVWVPVLNKYLVTTYAECHQVEMDQEIFSADVSGATMTRALGARPMLRKDGSEHTNDRKAINPTLRLKNITETWSPVFERNAGRYLEVLADAGPETADLKRDYAAPVAAQNLIDLLGLPDVHIDEVRRWSRAFVAGVGNVLDDPAIWVRCDAARAELDQLLAELVPFYRAHPNASVTSALANSGLPFANVASNVKLMISGGMNEPQHVLATMVWTMHRHPDLRELVVADPALWPSVFDETLRWQSPIGMYPRETTRPVVLGGVELPAGASLGVVVASANRDRAQFGATADAFDVRRPKSFHLAFGSGVHLCAGHWAAKFSIGRIAAPMLLRRFPTLRVDMRRPTTWEGWVFRGITQLPVTWD
jgi:cytochrome P450